VHEAGDDVHTSRVGKLGTLSGAGFSFRGVIQISRGREGMPSSNPRSAGGYVVNAVWSANLTYVWERHSSHPRTFT
jgi:hypothetical protein